MAETEGRLAMKFVGKFVGGKFIASTLLLIALFVLGSVSVSFGQETDDPVKIEIYKRFYDNRNNNQAVAYVAARDYLQKYAKDKDQYVDYLQKWVMVYERDDRKRKLPVLIN